MRRYFLHDKIKSERRPDDRQAFAFLLVSSDRFQYTIDKESCAARNQQEVSGGAGESVDTRTEKGAAVYE